MITSVRAYLFKFIWIWNFVDLASAHNMFILSIFRVLKRIDTCPINFHNQVCFIHQSYVEIYNKQSFYLSNRV